MVWTRETLGNVRLLPIASGPYSWNTLPTRQEVLDWFRVLEAGWVHDGNPKKAHVILHSGKHSNGFFLCKRVLGWPNLREVLAACVAHELQKAGLEHVDGVFGAPYSSITLAADVGRLLGVHNYIPEKDPAGGMIFKSDDPIPESSILLQIEELVTTLDSAAMAREAIAKGNPPPSEATKIIMS